LATRKPRTTRKASGLENGALPNLRLANDLQEWNIWLTSERSRIRNQLRRVRRHNENLRVRNEKGTLPQIQLLDEPHFPRANFAQVNLDEIRKSPKDVEPRPLSVMDVIHLLSSQGKSKGFSRESFVPIYHVYRVLSSIGPHPSPYVYDSYVEVYFNDSFVRTNDFPTPANSGNQTLVNAIFSTALLSEWVLKSDEGYAPVSRKTRRQLEPDSSNARGWTPGLP